MSIPANEVTDGQRFRKLDGGEILVSFGQIGRVLLARKTHQEDGRWLGWNELRGDDEGVRRIDLDAPVIPVL